MALLLRLLRQPGGAPVASEIARQNTTRRESGSKRRLPQDDDDGPRAGAARRPTTRAPSSSREQRGRLGAPAPAAAGRPRSAGRRAAPGAPPPRGRRTRPSARTRARFALSPPDWNASASSRAPGSSGSAASSISRVRWLSRAIAAAWPIRPNPVTSVAAVTPEAQRRPRGLAVERGHRARRRGDRLLGRLAGLERRRDHAGAERLGEHERLARAAGPAFVSMRRGVDEAGDRVAELDLGIAHAVAAEQHAAGLAQLVVRRRARWPRAHSSGKSASGNAAIESAVSGRPPIA